MKTIRITSAALIAATAIGGVAAPSLASAQPYGSYAYDDCRAREHSNGTAGAIIGGIAGALLGSSVAPHHGNRAGGAAIGGVAGALIGNSIGRSSAKDNSYACNGYYDGRGYSAPTRYYNGGYDGRYGYNNSYYATPYSYTYERPYAYERPTYYYPY